MLIGFGFGNWWQSLLMLAGTGLASYLVYRATRGRAGRTVPKPSRAQLRRELYEQRRRARELAREYDVSDEEIERRIDAVCGPPHAGRVGGDTEGDGRSGR